MGAQAVSQNLQKQDEALNCRCMRRTPPFGRATICNTAVAARRIRPPTTCSCSAPPRCWLVCWQKTPRPTKKRRVLSTSGMQELLWLPDQGAFAESKDLYAPQTAYNNPALWTVYHTIDSEVPTPRQAWQMAAERIAVLGRIPVHGEGVPAGNFYMLSCSNWMPYLWSLNLIVLAENTHMALALWQAGMADEAFALFKGNLLDSMFMGLCPGDFHMTSALDPHRQEAQRDFGDPIGITSRAYVEGLFGVQPNLIANEIKLRPGFPREWNHASLTHKDFDFLLRREGMTET